MKLIAYISFFLMALNFGHTLLDSARRNKTELFRRIISAECAEFGEVPHGTVSKINATSIQGVHIDCEEGYDLIGGPKVLCNDGRWDTPTRPICAKRCKAAPLLRDGQTRYVDTRYEILGYYRHGTKAVYSCSPGFQLSPPSSHTRSCHDGVWTGLAATCVSNGCPQPPPVANGYHVLEPLRTPPVAVIAQIGSETQEIVSVEQRVHYSCNVGYVLQGPASLQCLASGQWNPRQPPKCVLPADPATDPPFPFPRLSEMEKGRSSAHSSPPFPPPICPPAPALHHTQVSVLDGPQTANNAASGARLEVRCRDGFRDPGAPCVPSVLYCKQGTWVGSLPVCEPVSDCPPPPYVQHGTLTPLPPGESSYPVGAVLSYKCDPGYVLIGEKTLKCAASGCWEPDTLPSCKADPQMYVPPFACPPPPLVEHSTMSSPSSEASYPVGTAVTYSCFQGFLMEGEHVLRCDASGSWSPTPLPTCKIDPQPYAYLSTSSVLLVSLAVALGVSLILLVVCVVVVCRHQGPKTRPGVSSPSSSAGGSGAHRGGCNGPPAGLGGQRHSSPAGCGTTSGSVLHDPDRVALIAFADGVQLGESTALPTYEEAVRGCDRNVTGIGGMMGGGNGSGTLSAGSGQGLGHRSHGRGHWAGLGSGRRPVHVTRQSSSTSHTASLRSGSAAGDSMGSTDTMTPSEVSTTVTLDTVSSHTCSSGLSGSGSGSGGAASCRAICGSLASFDTSSALNTEGVPLLEESELEDADLAGPCKRRRPSPDPPGIA